MSKSSDGTIGPNVKVNHRNNSQTVLITKIKDDFNTSEKIATKIESLGVTKCNILTIKFTLAKTLTASGTFTPLKFTDLNNTH